jgi:hypothetical protein
VAQGDADERGDFGLACLRYRHGNRGPEVAVAILQSALLTCALIGSVGSVLMIAARE